MISHKNFVATISPFYHLFKSRTPLPKPQAHLAHCTTTMLGHNKQCRIATRQIMPLLLRHFRTDGIWTVLVHGAQLVDIGARQIPVADWVKELLQTAGIRLEIDVFHELVYDSYTARDDKERLQFAQRCNYAEDMMRIQTEVDTRMALWEMGIHNLLRKEVNVLKMVQGLIKKYQELVHRWMKVL